MKTVTLSEAKAKFSKVIDQVAEGEEFLITRMGKPVARISQLEPVNVAKRLGFMKGQGRMSEDFDEWPDEEAGFLGLVD